MYPGGLIELVIFVMYIVVSKDSSADQVYVEKNFLHAAFPASEKIWILIPNLEAFSASNCQVVKGFKYFYVILQVQNL